MPKPTITRRELGQVRVAVPVGPDELAQRICCVRQEQHVSLQGCLHCPRLAELQYADNELSAVFCAAGEEQGAAGHELSMRVPSVEAVMSRSFTCARADLTLDAVTELFLTNECDVLPVVDELGVLLGFVRQQDVQLEVHARASAADESASASPRAVGNVMMPYPLEIPERSPLTRAAGVLAYERQSHAAIVASDGSLVGVIAAQDVLRWLARADGYLI